MPSWDVIYEAKGAGHRIRNGRSCESIVANMDGGNHISYGACFRRLFSIDIMWLSKKTSRISLSDTFVNVFPLRRRLKDVSDPAR